MRQRHPIATLIAVGWNIGVAVVAIRQGYAWIAGITLLLVALFAWAEIKAQRRHRGERRGVVLSERNGRPAP